MALSPDGRTLVTANFGPAILWDLTDRAKPRRLSQPLTSATDVVMSVAFSPDGHTVATAHPNGTFTLWDLTDRNQPRRLGPPLTRMGRDITDSLSLVNLVAFSADGRTLATVDGTTVTLWDLTPLEELRRNAIKEACTRAGGSLDEAAWNLYAPDLSYQDTCAGR
jgi:WD40 repeat protein